jgi:hypothetical protein
MTPDEVTCGPGGDTCAVCVITALGLAFAIVLSTVGTSEDARSSAPPAFDPSRFILNALLVPALDADAVPFRWIDPRPALRCGPDTTVLVNRAPLLAGALVPDTPFELEWSTDGCRPFGARGPRFDGRVRLTVFREDWGFSAVVEPSGLRVASPDNKTMSIRLGAALLPQSVDANETDEFEPIGPDHPSP